MELLDLWFFSSLSKYFKSLAVTAFVAGLDAPGEDDVNYAEVRIVGPHQRPVHGGGRVRVDVNVICKFSLEGNRYDKPKFVGQIREAMLKPLPVYRDDGTLLGCLRLDGDLKVISLGRPNLTDKLEYVMLDGRYAMTI